MKFICSRGNLWEIIFHFIACVFVKISSPAPDKSMPSHKNFQEIKYLVNYLIIPTLKVDLVDPWEEIDDYNNNKLGQSCAKSGQA